MPSWLALGLLLVAAAPPAALATHFRYGHVTWAVQPGSNDVTFEAQAGWRLNANPCVDVASPTPETGVACRTPDTPAVGDVIIDKTSDGGENHGLQFGDASSLQKPFYLVTSVDTANNWLFGLGMDPVRLPGIETILHHVYADAGPHTAVLAGCCRLDKDDHNEHVNNANKPFRVETTVQLDSANSAPVSALPPIVGCPANGLCRFRIPAADLNHDALTFRMATSDEAVGAVADPGKMFVQPPGATIDVAVGEYTWDTRGAQRATDPAKNTLYSTQVIIEDHDATNAVKSKVAVDFMIRLTDEITKPPDFRNSPCDQTFDAVGGRSLGFTITAKDNDRNDIVTLNAVGGPRDAILTPQLPIVGSKNDDVSTTFAWTPSGNQPEQFVATFVASDRAGAMSFCIVTLNHVPCTDSASCSDGIDCTDDECNPQTGCRPPVPNDNRCVPANDCTTPHCSSTAAKDTTGCVQHELNSFTCCSNCIDDDLDGAFDIQDQDCCAASLPAVLPEQAGPRIRWTRHGTRAFVRLRVQMPEQIFSDANPTDRSDPLELIVTKGKEALLCGTLPADQWIRTRRGSWRFLDRLGTTAGGVREATIRDVHLVQRSEIDVRARVKGAGKLHGAVGFALGSKARCPNTSASRTPP